MALQKDHELDAPRQVVGVDQYLRYRLEICSDSRLREGGGGVSGLLGLRAICMENFV